MDAGIILSGRVPDIAGSLARGSGAAQLINRGRRENALAQFYQDQGPAVMAGDPNALTGLAQYDPQAALGVQAMHQGMQMDRERFNMERQEAALKAAEYAKTKTAEQAAEEAARIEDALAGAAPLYQSGDRAGYAAWLQREGLDPAQYPFEQFPSFAAKLGGVRDALKSVIDMQPKPVEPSAAEAQIARIQQAYGVDYRTAVGIADGVVTASTDPLTREVTIVDKITGQRIGAPQGQPQAAPQAAPAQPAPQPAPAASPELGFGEAFRGAPDAFGVEGWARGVANTAADVLPFAPTPFPETQQTQADFAVLRENLVRRIANAYDRQPPAALLEAIRALTPQAASPFEGPDQALTKLNALGRSLDSERQTIEAQLAGRLSPDERERLRGQLVAINDGLRQLNAARESLQPSLNLRPEVAERLKAYQ